MAQAGKPPETGSPTDAPAEQRPPEARADTPTSLSADAEKDAQVEAAKAKVAAAKEAAAQKAGAGAPAAPKPPVKKKDEGPEAGRCGKSSAGQKLKERLGEAVLEASEFLGQLSIAIAPERIVEACTFSAMTRKRRSITCRSDVRSLSRQSQRAFSGRL
jgi:hypothetical protein